MIGWTIIYKKCIQHCFVIKEIYTHFGKFGNYWNEMSLMDKVNWSMLETMTKLISWRVRIRDTNRICLPWMCAYGQSYHTKRHGNDHHLNVLNSNKNRIILPKKEKCSSESKATLLFLVRASIDCLSETLIAIWMLKFWKNCNKKKVRKLTLNVRWRSISFVYNKNSSRMVIFDI